MSCLRLPSMGPRPFGRGRPIFASRPTRAGTRFNGAATFRSRKDRLILATSGLGAGFNGAATFRSRKAASLPARSADANALQWGRDLSVAEGPPWWIGSASTARLQWGRDLSVAEGPRPRGRGPIEAGFNGAATFRSRKVAIRHGGHCPSA